MGSTQYLWLSKKWSLPHIFSFGIDVRESDFTVAKPEKKIQQHAVGVGLLRDKLLQAHRENVTGDDSELQRNPSSHEGMRTFKDVDTAKKLRRFGDGILGNRTQTGHFLAHIENLTERVQRCINEGPIINTRHADVERVVHVLNQALARKLACVLRYKRHFSSAEGMNAPSAAEEFLQRATEQSAHTEMIAERIRQLGGRPDFRLATSRARKGSEFGEVSALDALIREDLEAQRIAIASYMEIIRWLGDDDPTTRRVFEQILIMEKEHAEDMLDLLVGVNY